jgi:hypothetical protein
MGVTLQIGTRSLFEDQGGWWHISNSGRATAREEEEEEEEEEESVLRTHFSLPVQFSYRRYGIVQRY